MFTKSVTGERAWQWERRLYVAPEPQIELCCGEGWSFHRKDASFGWTHYCLFLSLTGRRKAWHLSVGKGRFGRSDLYRQLRDACPEVLEWVTGYHGGKREPFPVEALKKVNWERIDDRRSTRPKEVLEKRRRNRVTATILREIEAAAAKGYAIGFGDVGQVNIGRLMKRDHDMDIDDVRDSVSDLMRQGVIGSSSKGLVMAKGKAHGE